MNYFIILRIFYFYELTIILRIVSHVYIIILYVNIFDTIFIIYDYMTGGQSFMYQLHSQKRSNCTRSAAGLLQLVEST